MPVVINEFEIVVPSAESTPVPTPGSGGTAAQGPGWSVELARKLQEQLRLAVERQQRLHAD
jgi:hypothetical protein